MCILYMFVYTYVAYIYRIYVPMCAYVYICKYVCIACIHITAHAHTHTHTYTHAGTHMPNRIKKVMESLLVTFK